MAAMKVDSAHSLLLETLIIISVDFRINEIVG